MLSQTVGKNSVFLIFPLSSCFSYLFTFFFLNFTPYKSYFFLTLTVAKRVWYSFVDREKTWFLPWRPSLVFNLTHQIYWEFLLVQYYFCLPLETSFEGCHWDIKNAPHTSLSIKNRRKQTNFYILRVEKKNTESVSGKFRLKLVYKFNMYRSIRLLLSDRICKDVIIY